MVFRLVCMKWRDVKKFCKRVLSKTCHQKKNADKQIVVSIIFHIAAYLRVQRLIFSLDGFWFLFWFYILVLINNLGYGKKNHL